MQLRCRAIAVVIFGAIGGSGALAQSLLAPEARAAGIATEGLALAVGWDSSALRLRGASHCSFDPTYGYVYCSNRCGADYQFFVCSRRSSGCCHVGKGYCDYLGYLRCRP